MSAAIKLLGGAAIAAAAYWYYEKSQTAAAVTTPAPLPVTTAPLPSAPGAPPVAMTPAPPAAVLPVTPAPVPVAQVYDNSNDLLTDARGNQVRAGDLMTYLRTTQENSNAGRGALSQLYWNVSQWNYWLSRAIGVDVQDTLPGFDDSPIDGATYKAARFSTGHLQGYRGAWARPGYRTINLSH